MSLPNYCACSPQQLDDHWPPVRHFQQLIQCPTVTLHLRRWCMDKFNRWHRINDSTEMATNQLHCHDIDIPINVLILNTVWHLLPHLGWGVRLSLSELERWGWYWIWPCILKYLNSAQACIFHTAAYRYENGFNYCHPSHGIAISRAKSSGVLPTDPGFPRTREMVTCITPPLNSNCVVKATSADTRWFSNVLVHVVRQRS